MIGEILWGVGAIELSMVGARVKIKKGMFKLSIGSVLSKLCQKLLHKYSKSINMSNFITNSLLINLQ